MEGSAVLLPSAAAPTRKGRRRAPFVQRYWAFLSYSHQDNATADWLHRELESYALPKTLVGRGIPHGVIPAKLSPVFRDRQELAAASDLSEEIREALAGSRVLIVLCSPAAARSHWTDAEIRLFKELRPEAPVLAAIVDGEPWASGLPGREAEECFPPALKVRYDARGRPTAQRAEPIAADLREGRDGKRLGFLKLVAGILDIGLDDLARREVQRRHRHLWAVTGAALAGMLVTTGLAVMSIQARDEARDQRREAEGLVGFMLGDLKDKLEPVGRLDALDAVGSRVLEYFEKQNTEDLSDEALAQRSRALTLMGEIATQRGDMDGALRRYAEAMTTTGEMLRRSPDDPQRMFDHAQNVFWVGDTAMRRGQTPRAEAMMREYRRLAERMVAADPENEKWQLEKNYATTNLGVLLLEQRRFEEAAAQFREALTTVEALTAAAPGNSDYQMARLEGLAWLSTALERSGRLDEALAQRERQLALLQPLVSMPNADASYRRLAMVAHRVLGRLFASKGDLAQGLLHYTHAVRMGDELMRAEPDNAEWAGFAAGPKLELGELQLQSGKPAEAGVNIRAGCDIAEQLIRRDSTIKDWRLDLRSDCLVLRARLAMAAGYLPEALSYLERARNLARTEARGAEPLDARYHFVRAQTLLGMAKVRQGDRAAGEADFRAAVAAWPAGPARPVWQGWRVLALQGAGNREAANETARRLEAIGYRYPTYIEDKRNLNRIS